MGIKAVRYTMNRTAEWQEQWGFAEPPLKLEGAADHWNFREDDDDYLIIV